MPTLIRENIDQVFGLVVKEERERILNDIIALLEEKKITLDHNYIFNIIYDLEYKKE